VNPLPVTDETLRLARRCVWYKEPAEALAQPIHLAAHVLAHGTMEDVGVLRRHVGPQGMVEALKNAPPGIIDARSWWYWHLVLLDVSPPPPLPQRSFGA
jgi:hypothetical protein